MAKTTQVSSHSIVGTVPLNTTIFESNLGLEAGWRYKVTRRKTPAIPTRVLGAGAFMKGEILRGTNGRVLRKGTGDYFGLRGRTIYCAGHISLARERMEVDDLPEKARRSIRFESAWHVKSPEQGEALLIEGSRAQNARTADPVDEMFELFIDTNECEEGAS